MTIQKTKRDAEIEIERPEQMLAFLDAEEQLIEEKISLLKQSGAKAVFTSKEVDERIQHACNNDGILLVGMMEDDGIEDIAAATGATLINHLDDATTESLGMLQSAYIDVSERADGRRTRLIVDVGPTSGLVTIDVGGGQGAAVEEYIRAMYDALRTLESVIDQPGTVLGGGSFHIAAALHLRDGRIHLWTSTPSHRRICPSAGNNSKYTRPQRWRRSNRHFAPTACCTSKQIRSFWCLQERTYW